MQSRYYDPEICRFINADSTDYLGATGTLLSYNLFAYCENDPVDYVDPSGCARNTMTLELYIKNEFGESKTEWGNTKLKLKVSGNNISITAKFDFSGGLKNEKLNNTKYSKLFLDGIKEKWKGSFNVYGYTVNLNTYASSNWKGIKIKMKNSLGISNTKRPFWAWSPTNVGSITMYKGYKGGKIKFTYSVFVKGFFVIWG